MISPLVQDFTEALAAMPRDHPQYRILTLLDEAIRRDVHFIERHPTTFFQCMWNTCWWYDCPEAAKHYDTIPVLAEHFLKLHPLLEEWRRRKEAAFPGFIWVRSLRPPNRPLGLGFVTELRCDGAAITDAVFTSDGRRIVSGCEDGSIRVWELRDGREIICLPGSGSKVNCLQLSGNDDLVMVGCDDGRVLVWNLWSGTLYRCFEGTAAPVNAIALSPDGRLIGVGAADGCVAIWDWRNRSESLRLGGHNAPVNCLVFSPEGERLASGSGVRARFDTAADCSIRVWNCDGGEELMCLRGPKWSVNTLAFATDGRRLFSGSNDESIWIWDLETLEERVLKLAAGPVLSLALYGNDSCVTSGHQCYTSYGYYAPPLRIYNLRAEREVGNVSEEGDVQRVVVSNSEKLLGAVTSGKIRVISLTKLGADQPRLRANPISGEVGLSPDGNLLVWRNLVIGVGDFGCSGWDLRTWEVLHIVPESSYEEAVKTAQHSGGGEWVLTVQDSETCFAKTPGFKAAAWFPERLGGMVSDRGGRKWAIKRGDHVYLLSLEGVPNRTDCRNCALQ